MPFFFSCSYDMREGASGGGRHWRDNRTLGNRGSFSFYETGMQSETGAKVGRKERSKCSMTSMRHKMVLKVRPAYS